MSIGVWRVLGLQFGIPVVVFCLYWLWAAAMLTGDIEAAYAAGALDIVRGHLPSWGYIEAVGTLGPFMLLVMLTGPIWRATLRKGVSYGFGASSRFLLGATWGCLLLI